MLTRRPRTPLWSLFASVIVTAGTGCDARVLDAVEMIARPEGGTGGMEGGPSPGDGAATEGGARPDGALEDGGFTDASPPADVVFDIGGGLDASCSSDADSNPTTWPNCVSSANSDAWLAQHHDTLSAIHPRLLVLHFYNGWSKAEAEAGAALQIRALREGSRYHGYAQSNASPFLQYELIKTIDLTDHPPPPTWTNPSSTRVPVTANGDFDTAALFTQKFADDMGAQGFADPASSRNLTLCEIFERGLVNEAWLLVGEPGRRRPPLVLERKQVYDAAGIAVAGSFVCIKGGACAPEITCRNTVRMAHLDPIRGAGCDLDVRGWNIESQRSAIPYLDVNLRAFFNADFKARFRSPFDSFDEICDKNYTQCVSYPNPTTAAGTLNGVSWKIEPFTQGCGTPEFPPNARWRYDWSNNVQVQSRCEHYGMRDGDGGQDMPDIYTADKAATYDTAFGDSDCGTGWQVYWRQNLPGLGTTAVDADGKRMKNFWPFLFY